MRSPATATHTTSPSWARRAGETIWATPRRVSAATRATPVALEADERVAGPGGGHDPLDEAHLGARVDPLDAVGVGLDATEHPLDRPADGGDGGDAEALVDGGPALVVDAGHDPLDAEELTGRAGHEDVRVVAVGDRGERTGPLDAGGDQDVAVEARRPRRSRPRSPRGGDGRRSACGRPPRRCDPGSRGWRPDRNRPDHTRRRRRARAQHLHGPSGHGGRS